MFAVNPHFACPSHVRALAHLRFFHALFSQTEENACDNVSIQSREALSNTAITLFVSPNPRLILITEDELIPRPRVSSRDRAPSRQCSKRR
jgi:hypothetical protein